MTVEEQTTPNFSVACEYKKYAGVFNVYLTFDPELMPLHVHWLLLFSRCASDPAMIDRKKKEQTKLY